MNRHADGDDDIVKNGTCAILCRNFGRRADVLLHDGRLPVATNQIITQSIEMETPIHNQGKAIGFMVDLIRNRTLDTLIGELISSPLKQRAHLNPSIIIFFCNFLTD